jgi:membrane protein YqaA with SNARE-associated domain
VALGGISFAEASFFPIPPDPLLWAMCLGKRERSFWYATVTTVTSVAGGVLGWILGKYLFTDVVDWGITALNWHETWYGSEAPLDAAQLAAAKLDGFAEYPKGLFHKAYVLFADYGFWALFIAALTPIPYKVATVASGVFGLGLPAVVFGSILGRGMRFFAFAGLFYWFGPWAKGFIEKHFTWISIALAVLVVAGFAALKWLDFLFSGFGPG